MLYVFIFILYPFIIIKYIRTIIKMHYYSYLIHQVLYILILNIFYGLYITTLKITKK